MSRTMKPTLDGGGFLTEDSSLETITTPEDAGDEHQMIAKTTKDFVAAEVAPKLEALEEHDFEQAVKLFQAAGELGLLAADVPEEYGGIGLDQLGSALVTENFSAAQGFAVAHNIHVGVGTLPIVYFGNEHQKQTYLPAIASGQKVAAYALTEPGAGSDALSGKTTAVLNEEGTHYILNGEKQWITNASIADVFTVFAQVDREHFTAFIVDRESKGLSTGPEEKKMGIHSCSTATLNLEDVEVSKENVIWEVGKGHLVALNILNLARYKLGLMGIGQSKKALQLAIKYAKERQQFQQPIASFPLIQEKLADMAVQVYAAESSLYRTSGLLEEQLGNFSEDYGEDSEAAAKLIGEYLIECALNKFYASEMLDYVVDESLQTYGGYGFMSEYEIETMYRDARIDRIFEGTNEINRMAAGRALIKKRLKDPSFAERLLHDGENESDEMENTSQHQPLENEKQMRTAARKLFKETFNAAFQKYGKQLDGEQELLSKLADLMADVYAIDSVICRTEKSIAKGKTADHQQKIDMTAVVCQESLEKMFALAGKVMNRVQDQESMKKIRSDYMQWVSADCIEKKRKITEKLLDKEDYAV